MQKYITDTSEIDFDFQYPDLDSYVFSELKNITQINFDIETDELEKVKIIAGYTHNLFSHNGNNIPSSCDPITIINEAKQGKSFRCVEYSYLTTTLLWAYKIPARIIGLKTNNMETREAGAGHVVIEFWSNEFQKWIMADVQAGIIPKADGVCLSAFEFGEKIDQNRNIEFVLINNSRFSIGNDKQKYIEWIKEYLYFFDTPIRMNLFENYSEKDRLQEQKVMLIPLGISPPQVFQKIFPINAVYTHSVLDFYKK